MYAKLEYARHTDISTWNAWVDDPWNPFCDAVVGTVCSAQRECNWVFACRRGRHRSLGWAVASAILLVLLGADVFIQCPRAHLVSVGARNAMDGCFLLLKCYGLLIMCMARL